MRIETARITLRPVEDRDFPNIFRLMSDPEVMKYIRPASDDPEDTRKRMADWARYTDAHPGLGVFMAEWKADSAFIGYVVARHVDFDSSSGEYEVGYTLAPEQWGKGAATEITRSLCEYLFDRFAQKSPAPCASTCSIDLGPSMWWHLPQLKTWPLNKCCEKPVSRTSVCAMCMGAVRNTGCI